MRGRQMDEVGRSDIDGFDVVMTREERQRGFCVAFGYTADALRAIDTFLCKSGRVIVGLTVREILDEETAKRLAYRNGAM